MARKRKPLVVNRETVELDARGLHLVKRSNSAVQQYWEASPAARSRGYLPRTVRLHFDLETCEGRGALEQRCRILTNEMLAWLGDPHDINKPVYDGTLSSLISCYQTDKKSPTTGSPAIPSAATMTGAARGASDRQAPRRPFDRAGSAGLFSCAAAAVAFGGRAPGQTCAGLRALDVVNSPQLWCRTRTRGLSRSCLGTRAHDAAGAQGRPNGLEGKAAAQGRNGFCGAARVAIARLRLGSRRSSNSRCARSTSSANGNGLASPRNCRATQS
jgi:hypothetical protein